MKIWFGQNPSDGFGQSAKSKAKFYSKLRSRRTRVEYDQWEPLLAQKS